MAGKSACRTSGLGSLTSIVEVNSYTFQHNGAKSNDAE